MEFKQIKELIKLVSEANISEIRLEEGEFKLTVRTASYSKITNAALQSPQVVTIPQVANPIQQATPVAPKQDGGEKNTDKAGSDETSNLVEIKSPMVGTFYRSPAPEKPTYVKVGDSVNPGTPICIIEAMKLFNEVESEVTGKIVKVLVEDATPVEYDQPLFLVDPNG